MATTSHEILMHMAALLDHTAATTSFSQTIMQTAPLNKNHVGKALHKLGVLADAAGIRIELALCHGAVIIVAYGAAQEPRGEVQPNDAAVRFAESVYRDLRLKSDWLQTDVAMFLNERATARTLRPEEFGPGIKLSVNSSAPVLAMKLHLLREPLPEDATDARDAEWLLERISVSSPNQIQHIYARAFPHERLSDTACQMVERIFHERAAVRR